jgi:hypothetical protein
MELLHQGNRSLRARVSELRRSSSSSSSSQAGGASGGGAKSAGGAAGSGGGALEAERSQEAVRWACCCRSITGPASVAAAGRPSRLPARVLRGAAPGPAALHGPAAAARLTDEPPLPCLPCRSLHQQLTNYEAIHKDSLSQLVAMSQDLAAQAQAARQHRQQQASLQQQVGARGAQCAPRLWPAAGDGAEQQELLP